MLAEIRSFSNFGPLNPNLAFIYAHRSCIACIAKFSVSAGSEICNTVDLSENQYIIFGQRLKITK